MNQPIVAIDSIHFNNGSVISPPAPGVTVVVGPNNAGKTLLLKELVASIGLTEGGSRRLIQDIKTAKGVDAAGALDWLKQHGTPLHDDQSQYSIHGSTVNVAYFQRLFADEDGSPLRGSPHAFAFFGDVDQRASTYTPTGLYDALTASPMAPLHYLYAKPDLEREVARLAEKNFGSPFTLNRVGTTLELRTGSTLLEPIVDGVPNPDYVDAMRKMVPVSEQGHGVRSFMGLYLALSAKTYPVAIIDEPEAFLHPPQARSLGYEIARLANMNSTQAILATHSLDMLKGVLDYSSENTLVIRLARSGEESHITHLAPALINKLWADPLLRFSGVLDGLFYQLTVLCEGDPDCRFFSAVGSTMNFQPGETSTTDVNFVPVGGKARFPVALEALKAIGVPVRILADFDLVRGRSELARIVDAAGGDWAKVEPDWTRGVKSIEDSGAAVSTAYLLEKIASIVEGSPKLTRELKKAIQQELVTNDLWATVKRTGLAGVPHGDQTVACRLLLDKLSELGIFASPFGELESLVPEVGGHGPGWLAQVFEGRLHESSQNAKQLLGWVLKST